MASEGTTTHPRRESRPGGRRARLVERAALGDLRPSWDRLVDKSASPTPFLKSWWIDNTAQGEVVYLLAVDADGSLLGGLALQRDRVGPNGVGPDRLRSVGQPTLAPDHIDVVAAAPHYPEVAAAVAGWIREGDHVVDLDGLAASSDLPWLLDAPTVSLEAAPYLPIDPVDPTGHLPGRLRSTIRRSGRRLDKAGWSPRRVPVADAEPAVARLLDLHEHRWEEDSALRTGRGRLAAALVSGISRGDVVIHELAREDEVIASEVELLAGERVCFYQAGRLTDHEFRGSGSVLKAAVLEWAAEAGYREFDLLRGEESYKDDWATRVRTVRRIRTGYGWRGAAGAAAMNTWKTLAGRLVGLRSADPTAS